MKKLGLLIGLLLIPVTALGLKIDVSQMDKRSMSDLFFKLEGETGQEAQALLQKLKGKYLRPDVTLNDIAKALDGARGNVDAVDYRELVKDMDYATFVREELLQYDGLLELKLFVPEQISWLKPMLDSIEGNSGFKSPSIDHLKTCLGSIGVTTSQEEARKSLQCFFPPLEQMARMRDDSPEAWLNSCDINPTLVALVPTMSRNGKILSGRDDLPNAVLNANKTATQEEAKKILSNYYTFSEPGSDSAKSGKLVDTTSNIHGVAAAVIVIGTVAYIFKEQLAAAVAAIKASLGFDKKRKHSNKC